MRNISFALTTQQFRDRTKTVTRRLGWRNLKPGDRLGGCVKCMGLRKGESIDRLGVIEVVSVRLEPLRAMTDDEEYGRAETTAEGFPPGDPKHDPHVFVGMFCDNMRCTPETEVTRIEYRYVDDEAEAA